jgi:hypothetical protein
MSFEYHSCSVLNFLNSVLGSVELLVVCASIFSNCTIETERLRIIKTTKIDELTNVLYLQAITKWVILSNIIGKGKR